MSYAYDSRAHWPTDAPHKDVEWARVHSVPRNSLPALARWGQVADCGFVRKEPEGIRMRMSLAGTGTTILAFDKKARYGLRHSSGCNGSDNCRHIHAYRMYLGLERVRKITGGGRQIYPSQADYGNDPPRKKRFTGGLMPRHDGRGNTW